MEMKEMMQIAFGVFLLVNILVGLWAGRKVKTMQDYALANQSLGLGVLTISFLATFFELGSISFNASYRLGIQVVWPFLGLAISMSFFFGLWLLPKLRYFKNCYTLGDVTKQLYGARAASFTSFFSVVFSLFIVVAQIAYMGAWGPFIGLSNREMVLIIGSVVVLYSFFGGVRTITSTDVMQFVFLVIGITITAQTVFAKVGGLKSCFSDWPADKKHQKLLSLGSWATLFKPVLATLFLGIVPVYILAPPFFQRYQMVQDKRRITRMLWTVAIFSFVFKIIVMLVGLALHRLYNAGEYAKEKDRISFFIKLSSECLSDIPQLLFFLMILAVGFSTIDSHLGALSVVVAHNFAYPLILKKGIKSEKKELMWARRIGIGLGTCCVLLALWGTNNIVILRPLAFYNIALFGIVFVPSVAGIVGVKVHSASFWANCFTYLLTTGIVFFLFMSRLGIALFYKIALTGLSSMFMGAIAFFITNYRVCGGFHMVQRGEKKRFSYRKEAEVSRLGAWFKWLTSPIVWAQEKVAQYGKEATLAPLFLCISTMIPHVSPTEAMQESMNIWLLTSVISMLLCAGLLIQDSWPDSWKRYSDVYWFFTMMYCIPFTHVLWFLNDHKDNTIVLMRMAIAIILMIVLVDWYSFLLLSGIGTGVAFFVQYLLKGGDGFCFSFDELWPIGFGLGHVLLAGALFARRREKSTREQISRAKVLSSSLGHELGNTLSGARGYVHYVMEMVKRNTIVDDQGEKKLVVEKGAYHDFVQDLSKGERLMDLMPRQMAMFRQMIQFDGVAEHKLRTVPIDLVLRLACDRFRLIHKDYADVIELVDGEAPFSVRMWDELFFHVIVNLAKNAIVHGGSQKVRISWNAEEHAVYVQDNGCGISPSAVPRIFDVFYTTSGAGTGVGLSFVRNVMHAFHGEIHLVETGDEGTLFKLTFPKV